MNCCTSTACKQKFLLVLRATARVGEGAGVRRTVVGVLLLLLLVSKLHLILRATAPMGGGDGILRKLLLVLQVDGTHQKYSSV